MRKEHKPLPQNKYVNSRRIEDSNIDEGKNRRKEDRRVKCLRSVTGKALL